MRRYSVVLLCIVCAACASSGAGTSPEPPAAIVLPESTAFEGTTRGFTSQPSAVHDTVLTAPRDRVWSALPYVLDRLGVEASTFDARTFVMGNEGWRPSRLEGARLSSFLQCGSGISGPNADAYEVTMQLLVQLEPQGTEGTLVRTVLDAYARPRYSRGATLQCSSQGTLERRVAALIIERLTQPERPAPVVALGEGPVPDVGDPVRLECSTAFLGPVLHEGAFLGGEGGEIRLGLEPAGDELHVPAASVIRVQVPERRSRKGVGTVIGAVIGLASGAFVGRSFYDPSGLSHYTPGVITTVGGVLGGIAGALLGRLTGSFVERDVWVDAAPGWARSFSVPGAAADASATGAAGGTTACSGAP